MNDWNDPMSPETPPEAPVHEAPGQALRMHEAPRQDAPPQGGQIPPKKPLSKRLVALCLSCALLGGASGGALVSLLPRGGDGGHAVIYEGSRPEVVLEQVSTDLKKPLTVPEIYANYADACVGISVDIVTKNYFGQTVKGAAAGSGFVITEDGYIVTNYHVVADANAITVSFVDGSSYPATYVGGDERSDVAVLKINASGLVPVVVGDSDNMNVGETVATIGNPLGELTFSLSDGVISALDRSITLSDGSRMNMLQTNCPINSGNSGGPLFNLYGEAIGIVSAKYSTSGGVFSSEASIEGLGFAIPINDVKDMITDLIEKGYISGRPYLGISVQNATAGALRGGALIGAQVIYATPGLAAFEAGLMEGDVIIAVGETLVDSSAALIDANNKYKAGDTVDFTVSRQGQDLTIPVTFDEKTTQNEQAHIAYAESRAAEEPQTQQQQQLPEGMVPETVPPDGEQIPEPYNDYYEYFYNWPFN